MDTKPDNPVVKFGLFIVVPVCAILLGASILSQTCGAPVKVPAVKVTPTKTSTTTIVVEVPTSTSTPDASVRD